MGRGRTKTKLTRSNPFHLREAKQASRDRKSQIHVYGRGVVCDTDKRGYATPKGQSLTEIVVDASEGFIPLWAKDMTLRWRFQERSMTVFEDPEAAKSEMRKLLGEALLAWDDAVPIKFAEREDAWDFELVTEMSDDCDPNGCVLARAFFPDTGQHKLSLLPELFAQSRKEQLDTLIHETGHIFGLRHFFAQITETTWRSEVFGKHRPFSIMNYGNQSRLTKADKADLRRLYQMAWSGDLKQINGTPIRFMKPFHTLGQSS